MSLKDNKSVFYVVATPIGNLGDMSFRAIEVLKSVDFILAEDTRVTKKLLNFYKIEQKVFSYNAHASEDKNNKILEELENGKSIALVSDAGTPTISDPGFKIISDIRNKMSEKVDIIPIPGPSALITALSVSGISSAQFVFYGFFPRKKGRQTLMTEIKDSKKTSVFYESPHRLLKTLQFLAENLNPDTGCMSRKVFVARELTKIYEEKISGSPQEVFDFFKNHPEKVKGEFVVIINTLR